MRRPWTAADVEELRTLAASGKSAYAISKIVDRPLSSICSKGVSKGIEFVPADTQRRAWTQPEIDKLRELHAAGRTASSVAQELGRPIVSVCDKAKALGLKWTDRVPPEVARSRDERLAEVRARVLSGLWEEGDRLLARIRDAQTEGFQDLVKGSGGAEVADTMPFVPSRAASSVTRAVSDLVRTAAQIEALQQTSRDDSDIDEWLKAMKGGSNASGSNEGLSGEPERD